MAGVEITVKPLHGCAHALLVRQHFSFDTLWQHTQTLEAAGETKAQIPDSIFPNASFPLRSTLCFSQQ